MAAAAALVEIGIPGPASSTENSQNSGSSLFSQLPQ
jgi:hypothetical protein